MPQPTSEPERILQRLDWTVIRKMDGLLQGDYRTLFRGFGLELAELREYQLTDDVRSIDWYVTARMQTPFVRQFMEDREVTAWFLLDLSPSVDFGTTSRQKRGLLVDFVGVLARLLTRHGNRVGALLFTGKLERVIPAQGGRMHVLRLIRALTEQPRLKRAPQTDLVPLLASALRIIRRRSLVFVVSDFLSVPGWDKPLDMLSRTNEVLAVRISDPREMELPDIGPIVFEDAETGEQLFLDTHDRGFRKRFVEAARRRRTDLDAMLKRSGVEMLSLTTDGDMSREIVRFAAERRQRRNPRGTAAWMAPGARAFVRRG
jgi:uncharacterized protein (DUF58 family)